MSPRARLLIYAFLDEMGPLYALYVVWFVNNGMSASMVSALYGMWAFIGLVAEIPSGALADRVDRRVVMAVSLLLRALGLAIWVVWPSPPAFFVGAALWAIHSSFASGTWEALVYDQLAAAGQTHTYTTTMARIGQAISLGGATGMLAAPAMLWLGMSIPMTGWVTIAVHVPAVAVLLSLPRVAPQEAASTDAPAIDEDRSDFGAWWSTLRAGIVAALSGGLILRMVVLGALLEGLFNMDDYQPLVATARGAPDAVVPFLVFAVWAGLVVGGEAAARLPRLAAGWVGAVVVAAAGVTAVALLAGGIAPLALIGLAYAGQYLAWVLWEARFQERIPGHLRATVASVRSFFGNLLSISVFGFVGLVSGADPTWALLPLVGLLAGTGVLMMIWLPPSGKTASPLPGADGEEDGRDAVEQEGLLGGDGGPTRTVQ